MIKGYFEVLDNAQAFLIKLNKDWQRNDEASWNIIFWSVIQKCKVIIFHLNQQYLFRSFLTNCSAPLYHPLKYLNFSTLLHIWHRNESLLWLQYNNSTTTLHYNNRIQTGFLWKQKHRNQNSVSRTTKSGNQSFTL